MKPLKLKKNPWPKKKNLTHQFEWKKEKKKKYIEEHWTLPQRNIGHFNEKKKIEDLNQEWQPLHWQ